MSASQRNAVPLETGIGAGGSWKLLETSHWLQVGEDGFVPDFPKHVPLLVPVGLWQVRREDLLEREGPLAVQIGADDDAAQLIPELGRFAADGRQIHVFHAGAPYPATTVVLRAAA